MTVEYTLLALAVPALLAAAGFAVWTHLRTRRMLDTLGKMLDDAIRGEFRESLYDESRLSALETRMAHYLSASAVSAKNLAEEKDAIKTLIGDISHQTKTPIANLLLYAQLLEEQDLPPESREYVSALEHQAEKLRFLIDALVKTSRLESGVLAMTPKRHGIQQLLDTASAQAAPGAEAKAITLTVEPTDLTARFDPKWTAEALYNLVDNAVKYTRPRLPSPTSCCMPSCWRSRTCRRRAGSMSPLWSIRRRSCGSSSTRWSKPPGWRAASLP